MIDIGEEVFSQVTHLGAYNATAASLVFARVMVLWATKLLSADSLPAWTKETQPPEVTRPRPFLRLGEFEPEQLKFEAEEGGDHSPPADCEGLPHGRGVLAIAQGEGEEGVEQQCVGNVCESAVKTIKGKFDRGSLTGFADIHYSNGDRLRANFGADGTLHGLAVRFNSRGQILSVSHFDSGVRTGPVWTFDYDFGAGLFGDTSRERKGKINGNDRDVLLLHMANPKDIFAVTGQFTDSILQGQGTPRRLSKLWFSHGGLVLNAGASTEPMEFIPGQEYRFHLAPNVVSAGDKIKVQSAWLATQRMSQLEPKGAVRDWDGLRRQREEGEGLFEEYLIDHERKECRALRQMEPKEDLVRERWLVSYPGSGTKWLAGTIKVATGLSARLTSKYQRDKSALAGTHHQDPARWNIDFKLEHKFGESKAWNRWSEELGYRLRSIRRMSGRAVILIRNPYDSILSFWNHDRSGFYGHGLFRDGVLDLADSVRSDLFRDFARQEVKMWEEIYLDYLSVGSDILVVHYEDMKEDLDREARRVLDFLRFPVEELRLQCSLTMNHDLIKRKKRPPLEDPFTQDLHRMVDSAIDKIQEALDFRGQPPLPVEKYRYHSRP